MAYALKMLIYLFLLCIATVNAVDQITVRFGTDDVLYSVNSDYTITKWASNNHDEGVGATYSTFPIQVSGGNAFTVSRTSPSIGATWFVLGPQNILESIFYISYDRFSNPVLASITSQNGSAWGPSTLKSAGISVASGSQITAIVAGGYHKVYYETVVDNVTKWNVAYNRGGTNAWAHRSLS